MSDQAARRPATTTSPAQGRSRLGSRDRRLIAVFLALAFASSWLVALPLWLGDGLAEPSFPVVAVLMMLTPGLAALAVVLVLERPPQKARALGVWPLKPVKRFLSYAALGVFVPIALVLAALPVGALLGVYPADVTGFSGYRQTLETQLAAAGQSDLPMSIEALVAVQLLTLPLAAVLNLIPALGEELGWRGWLLPKLLPLGTVPALLVSGVVWGLWHAPLVLLGYNYPDAPGWQGLLMMTGMCILVGAVFGWLRIRSGSVWPPALAHGAFNGAAGSYLIFAQAGERIDTTQATVLGWSGWLLPLALVAVLLISGKFRPAQTGTTDDPVTAVS